LIAGKTCTPAAADFETEFMHARAAVNGQAQILNLIGKTTQ
jgi:hypothetical protein